MKTRTLNRTKEIFQTELIRWLLSGLAGALGYFMTNAWTGISVPFVQKVLPEISNKVLLAISLTLFLLLLMVSALLCVTIFRGRTPSERHLRKEIRTLSLEEKDHLKSFFEPGKERMKIIFSDRDKDYDEMWMFLIKQGLCKSLGAGKIEGVQIDEKVFRLIMHKKSLIGL